nr:hypothetical protein [Actinacidiphila oryziradicis]
MSHWYEAHRLVLAVALPILLVGHFHTLTEVMQARSVHLDA